MAVYNKAQGLQSICNAALGEYRSRGFRLIEDRDHFLKLYYQDGLLDVFRKTRATIPAIHEACRAYLEGLAR